jgi:hypothetical protein
VYLYGQIQRKKAGPKLHFRCPNCRRKLSFKSAQRGQPGQCPQCRMYFDFPKLSDEERRAKRRGL